MAMRRLGRVSNHSSNAHNQGTLRRVFFSTAIAHHDAVDGGTGTIAGVVTIENIPGVRRVRLYNKLTGRLVRETWSSTTGAYVFAHINAAAEYFVVAHDHLRIHNAVVQDGLTP